MVGVLLVSAMIVIPTLTGFALVGASERPRPSPSPCAHLGDARAHRGLLSPLAAGGAIVLTASASSRWPRSPAERRRGPLGRLAHDPSPRGSARLAGAPRVRPDRTAGRHGPECPRWREAFAGMPTKMVTVQWARARTHCASRPQTRRSGGGRLSVRDARGDPAPPDPVRFARRSSRSSTEQCARRARHRLRQGRRRIFSILKMGAEPHHPLRPHGPFRYAIEARAGFFESQGIRQGEARLVLATEWGARNGPPHPPHARKRPGSPWRSSTSRFVHGLRVGGPDMAPHTPHTLGSAPAQPWRSSTSRFAHGR